MRILVLLIFLTFKLFASSINYNISYFVTKEELKLEAVKKQNFEKLKTKKINKGFDFRNFWFHLEVKNNTNTYLNKVFAIDNPSIDFIDFYDDEKLLFRTGDHRYTKLRDRDEIYYSFDITLLPNEKKDFYFKIHTTNAFVFKFDVLHEKIHKKRTQIKEYFLLFYFGFVASIIIYNSFLYVILKEKTYLYYIAFQTTLLLLLVSHSGLGYYLIWQDSPRINEFVLKTFDDFAIILAVLFTKSFLNTKKNLPNFNKAIYVALGLLFYVMLTPWEYHSALVKPVMLGSISLIVITAIYATYKKIPSSKLFLLGWLVLMSASFLTLFKNFGHIQASFLSVWGVYLGSMFEAIFFSIALANKIETLKKEKENALQVSKKILDKEVKKKTTSLRKLLQQNELLLKELHHRVKNNLQVIASFIKLTSMKDKSQESQERLSSLNDRVNVISSIHELLCDNTKLDKSDFYEYIYSIVKNLTWVYSKNKNIQIDIKVDDRHELKFDQMVNLGLIINELVTNSIKYAFDESIEKPEVKIDLEKKQKEYVLVVQDNGIGFDKELEQSDSLGLKIVNRLAKKQLDARVEFESSYGKAKYTISFGV